MVEEQERFCGKELYREMQKESSKCGFTAGLAAEHFVSKS